MSDLKTIGVGIIGLGVRGFDCIGMNKAQTCRETGCRIVALCDRNPATATSPTAVEPWSKRS